MLVILVLFLTFFMLFFFIFMLMLVFLHTLFDFFFLSFIAEDIQEVEDYHILVLCLSDDVGHPFVGLAAYIDEDVAVGYIYDIGRRGLVAVQIGAVVEQHIELDIHVILYDLAYPVIDGEDGGDNLDVGMVVLRSAAAREGGYHQ